MVNEDKSSKKPKQRHRLLTQTDDQEKMGITAVFRKRFFKTAGIMEAAEFIAVTEAWEKTIKRAPMLTLILTFCLGILNEINGEKGTIFGLTGLLFTAAFLFHLLSILVSYLGKSTANDVKITASNPLVTTHRMLENGFFVSLGSGLTFLLFCKPFTIQVW